MFNLSRALISEYKKNANKFMFSEPFSFEILFIFHDWYIYENLLTLSLLIGVNNAVGPGLMFEHKQYLLL